MGAGVDIGRLRGYYSAPDAPGSHPGLLVIHEIGGLNDDIRAITDRFAANGYAAVAPDLMSGGPRAICVARTIGDLARGASRSLASLAEAGRFLERQAGVDGARIGVVGFCMGGGLALLAAVRSPYAAAGVNYGSVPKTVEELRGVCPVVASYGGRDRALLQHARRLEQGLDELGVPHDVKVYPDAGHSFMNRHPALARVPFMHLGYREHDAEDAWRRMLDFFAEHLAPPR